MFRKLTRPMNRSPFYRPEQIVERDGRWWALDEDLNPEPVAGPYFEPEQAAAYLENANPG